MHTLDSLLEKSIKLPSLPAIAIKLLQIVNKDNLSITELSDVISYDPAMAAKILSVSNSSYYALPYKVDTIDKAISVLGMDTIKNISLSFALLKGMRKDKTEGFNHEFFWRRSITAAVSAEMISSKLGRVYRESFVTALLMDIGILVMYLCSPEDYQKVLDEKRVSDSSILDIERSVFNCDHQEVGSIMLNKWGIPENICSLIEHHHRKNGIHLDLIPAIKILQLSDLTSSIYHGTIENFNILKTRFEKEITDKEDIDIFLDSVASKTIEVLTFFDVGHGNMKPYSQILQEANEELIKLNRSYEHVIMELNQAKKRAENIAMELKVANAKLREIAFKDGLTGLYNHRYFQEIMDAEMERAKRYGYPLSLIMLDIDDFKYVNDTYGHPQGDEVLRYISSILQHSVRACDILARYGGEEFTMLLPETDIKGAAMLGERVRQRVEDKHIDFGGPSYKVTVSLGASTFDPFRTLSNKSIFINAADKALYDAKAKGKNRISVIKMSEN